MEQENEQRKIDYGVILYENSTAKSVYDAPDGKLSGKAIAQRVYMIILSVALFGWFLFSLITAAQSDGIGKAILEHLAPFFILVLAELILMFTAFNAWGKFSRAVLRHKALVRHHRMEGVLTRKLDSELKSADANKPKEYAIRIYKECVLVTNLGEDTVIPRSEIRLVKCDRNPNDRGYHLTFILNDDSEVVSERVFPLSDVPIVQKYFKRFEYTPEHYRKGYLKKKLPTIAFLFVPLLIGVALLILRSLILFGMPIIFGLVFISFSVLFIIAQFNDVAVINYGVFPILGGLLITGLPIAIMLTIGDLTKMTVAYMLSKFTVFHAGLSIFVGLGAMLVILGIAGLINCIKSGNAGAVDYE